MFKKSEKEKKSKNFETKKKVEKFFGGNFLFFGGNFLEEIFWRKFFGDGERRMLCYVSQLSHDQGICEG